ncbi:SUKH-4 family immunity protein [Streptomyces bohaiensis]|uniref:SUKH-4 family immunity protein n=1 Tax=Streptomyces bohaiensis TaxID=1431344 RepID=UPI003B813F48
MDDVELAELLDQREAFPYPGTWLAAPFANREAGGRKLAVVARDEGLSFIGVDRADGGVWGVPEGGAPNLVNTGLTELVACSRAYREASVRLAGTGDGPEAPGTKPLAGDHLTQTLVSRFREIDPAAVADENTFWSVAAEELGYAVAD